MSTDKISLSVAYATRFAEAAGTSLERVAASPNETIAELLESRAKVHGSALHSMLFDAAGQLKPAIMVCCNDSQVAEPQQHQLSDGDEILVLSAISGG